MLTLVATEIKPTLYLVEDCEGTRQCIHGASFLKAMVLLIKREMTYPVDGNIESMQCKCFDEEKRYIRDSSTSTAINEGGSNAVITERLFNELDVLYALKCLRSTNRK